MFQTAWGLWPLLEVGLFALSRCAPCWLHLGAGIRCSVQLLVYALCGPLFYQLSLVWPGFAPVGCTRTSLGYFLVLGSLIRGVRPVWRHPHFSFGLTTCTRVLLGSRFVWFHLRCRSLCLVGLDRLGTIKQPVVVCTSLFLPFKAFCWCAPVGCTLWLGFSLA